MSKSINKYTQVLKRGRKYLKKKKLNCELKKIHQRTIVNFQINEFYIVQDEYIVGLIWNTWLDRI